MDVDERYSYWIDLAEYDLETAKAMLNTERFLYVGFMCHQSIEKTIKAYHWKKIKNEPAYIHNLLRLAEQSELINDFNENHFTLINELNPLNIEARYPRAKEELLRNLNLKKCKRLLKQTQELIEWIKNRS